jgi:hypothetical protein
MASKASLSIKEVPPTFERVLGTRTTTSPGKLEMEAMIPALVLESMTGSESTPCGGDGQAGAMPTRRRLLLFPPMVSGILT